MPVIDVDGLTFSYASGTTPAVRDLSFRIDRGEIFGFLGPSGAGKSTTQKVLIGLLRGYRGAVSVLGRDLAGWGADYYERIGRLFRAAQPLSPADRGREPALLPGAVPGRDPPAGRAARDGGAGRRPRTPRLRVLQGHEDPAGGGARPAQRPATHLPGGADGGARPGQRAAHPETHSGDAGRRAHRVPDDARHDGSRRAVRPRGVHRRRRDTARRVAARSEAGPRRTDGRDGVRPRRPPRTARVPARRARRRRRCPGPAARGHRPHPAHPGSATLEEVFVRVTGQSLQ